MRFMLLMMLILPAAHASADSDVASDSVIDQAAAHYAAANYDLAIELLETAVQADPGCAACAHQLGRAYGRLAENVNWIAAVRLAKKSRLAFENAVELDPHNAQALEDLIRFYRDAPGFLGGDEEKANNLDSRLRRLRASQTG